MTRRCGICGGPSELRRRGAAPALGAAAFSPSCHTPRAYSDLYACRACGTIEQPGLPAGPQLLDRYRTMRDDAYLEEEAGRRATARRLLELVERRIARGRLLEVGCGHGLLLDEARARGWAVAGTEIADAARTHARDTLGLDVRPDPLHRVADGPYDAIVMADVLEHLDDPAAAIRDCAGLLRTGGALLVVTPDPASRTARLAGARWWGLLPAHTYLLPRPALRRLLRAHALEPVDEQGLARTFTLGYWVAGVAERSAALEALLAPLVRRRAARRPVTLSLGDETVMLATRAHGSGRVA